MSKKCEWCGDPIVQSRDDYRAPRVKTCWATCAMLWTRDRLKKVSDKMTFEEQMTLMQECLLEMRLWCR